jgi:hypothetical protein
MNEYYLPFFCSIRFSVYDTIKEMIIVRCLQPFHLNVITQIPRLATKGTAKP